MKKHFLRALLPFILCYIFLTSAFAPPLIGRAAPTQGDYACVLSDAYFYASPNESEGLFLLPKTYFVKLLDYDKEFCKIEYLYDSANTKKLVGYAKTEGLSFVDYVPQRPYLCYLFDVTYRIDETTDTDDPFLTQITLTCAYYGDYKIGSQLYCYVLREGEFGYIPKPSTLSYEENTEYADRLSPVQLPDDPSSSSNEGASPLQIAILVILCLLVPVLAALILKPPKRPPYDNDE